MEQHWNTTVIPGLVLLGIVSEGVSFGFDPTEDLTELWKMTTEAAAFLEIDPTWVKTKFGIQVIGAKKTEPAKLSLNIEDGFFV